MAAIYRFQSFVYVAWLLSACLAGQAASAQASTTPVSASDPAITARPRLTRGGLAPAYPATARIAKVQGLAAMDLCISEAGNVTAATLVNSTGSADLDKATLDWVRAALFEPARTAAGPAAVCSYRLEWEWKIDPVVHKAEPLVPSGSVNMYPRLGRFVKTPPTLLSKPAPPEYPKEVRSPRAHGDVKMELCVDPDGGVGYAHLVRSVELHLDFLALRWARGMRFEPPMHEGEPTGICGVPFVYTWVRPD